LPQRLANREGNDEALRYAREVLVGGEGEGDPTALAWAGHATTFFTKDPQAGFAAVDRAMLLAPHSAIVLMLGGWNQVYVGDSDQAVARFERAMRLSPRDPSLFLFQTGMAYAHFIGGRYEDALTWARQAVRDRPSYMVAQRMLAACAALTGQDDEARGAVEATLTHLPSYTAADAKAQTVLRDPTFIAALIRAGLPA
jgi:Flp pilus assembly protein TadD